MAPAQEPTSTPPAPPVSLAALLNRRDLGLRLLAGPADAAIHWVHTSEMADPYPYLLGGELLMTAGVQLAHPAHYVERVVAAGAAALGFGVAPVYDTVPEALVAACERHGLPLLEVPPHAGPVGARPHRLRIQRCARARKSARKDTLTAGA
ncbi:PucR family transcriptional regulator ligand-binding domain-containing protein, partial [Streptomyces sp. NPDC047981]|uniref:PucR family transcriptional regulator ligand-binding domain-containing protein n=1 Tax=Streptomyces sp. NPDC047981 TaxID=3154610 RepID=UPI003441DE6B